MIKLKWRACKVAARVARFYGVLSRSGAGQSCGQMALCHPVAGSYAGYLRGFFDVPGDR